MADVSQIRNFHLKVLFLIHFAFISFATIGNWSTSSYLFYNFVFILTLLWGIYRHDSDEPIQMAFVINGLSIILDIMLLAMNFPDSHSAPERFSAALAILHLIFRPFSIILLGKILKERNGTGTSIDGLFSGRNASYEDMDRNVPTSQPKQQGSYDFSTAQQI